MARVRLRDRKTIYWIRQKARITDVAEHLPRFKLKWAQHLMRPSNGDRKVTEWRLRG